MNNKTEQEQFLKDLTQNILDDILGHLSDGDIPENWDGIELRWLLAEKFTDSASLCDKATKRRKDYKNWMLVNNL